MFAVHCPTTDLHLTLEDIPVGAAASTGSPRRSDGDVKEACVAGPAAYRTDVAQ